MFPYAKIIASILLVGLFTAQALALPTPSVASVQPAVIGKAQQEGGKQSGISQASTDQPKIQAPAASSARRQLPNQEKLKRGLTNFMNQLNPAPFFVPAAPASTQQSVGSSPGANKSVKSTNGPQMSAEPAAIVNGDPTAEALIKGPNRLTQTRPIGGPLRWGR